MPKSPKLLLLSLSLSLSLSLGISLLAFSPLAFSDETLTITTYYPSPYGTYNQLQANSLAVGDTNGDSQMTSGDLPPENGQIYAARSVIYKPQNGTPASNAVIGELVYNDTDDSLYLYTGSSWEKQGGGGRYVPTSLKATTATHNGNFGGYQAMYQFVQSDSNCGTGYYVCSSYDIAAYYQFHPQVVDDPPSAWYNSASVSSTGGPNFDCEGWRGPDSQGSLWYRGVHPYSAACSSSYKVLCCK